MGTTGVDLRFSPSGFTWRSSDSHSNPQPGAAEAQQSALGLQLLRSSAQLLAFGEPGRPETGRSRWTWGRERRCGEDQKSNQRSFQGYWWWTFGLMQCWFPSNGALLLLLSIYLTCLLLLQFAKCWTCRRDGGVWWKGFGLIFHGCSILTTLAGWTRVGRVFINPFVMCLNPAWNNMAPRPWYLYHGHLSLSGFRSFAMSIQGYHHIYVLPCLMYMWPRIRPFG